MKIETVGKPKIGMTWDGYATITFTVNRERLPELEGIKANAAISVVDPKADKSRNQNAYMWALIGELAKKVEISKQECYREYIREYGVYKALEVKNEAAEAFEEAWKKQGVGWIVEKEDGREGYKNIMAYYGTSTYTAEQMARLIDAIVNDCKSYGIDVR